MAAFELEVFIYALGTKKQEKHLYILIAFIQVVKSTNTLCFIALLLSLNTPNWIHIINFLT